MKSKIKKVVLLAVLIFSCAHLLCAFADKQVRINGFKRSDLALENADKPSQVKKADSKSLSGKAPAAGKPKSVNTAENQVILIKNSDNRMSIYYKYKKNTLLYVEFAKKPWGVWNIQSWRRSGDGRIPTKRPIPMAGGGSDWEYVFRVADKKGNPYVFSGGNHGGERLKALYIFDGMGDKRILPLAGVKYRAENIKIVEHTDLYLGNLRYASVKREYHIYPNKIQFNATIEFASDIYMGTSYVCMMPVLKDYSRHVQFGQSGNVYHTPGPGKTLTQGRLENYIGKEETLSVLVWGDANPGYKFRVSIAGREMTDNYRNRLKTFIWDVNEYGNKLYFSKFDSEDYNAVKKGTIWKHSQQWELLIN